MSDVFDPSTGNILVSAAGGASTTYYETLLDDTVDGLYVGVASPGTLTSAASWQIKLVTDTSVLFADATSGFTKVWDNRATYTY